MIELVLSSCRPFGQNESYDALQRAAIDSWRFSGSNIRIFNGPDELPESQASLAVGRSRHIPTIYEMIEYGIEQVQGPESIIAIVNSDIVLGPELRGLEQVIRDHNMGRAWAATSFRYTYDPKKGIKQAWRDPLDLGLDLFIAPRRMWTILHQEMPALGADKLTIGRILWDNTVNGYFRERLPSHRYMDLTHWRCVFHPQHGERGRHEAYDDATISNLKLPFHGGIPSARYEQPTLR